MNTEKIKELTREFLIALGENPDREGLRETPERVARMCEEVFRGIAYTNEQVAEKYAKTFEADDMCVPKCGNYVVVKDIPSDSLAVGNPCQVIRKTEMNSK